MSERGGPVRKFLTYGVMLSAFGSAVWSLKDLGDFRNWVPGNGITQKSPFLLPQTSVGGITMEEFSTIGIMPIEVPEELSTRLLIAPTAKDSIKSSDLVRFQQAFEEAFYDSFKDNGNYTREKILNLYPYQQTYEFFKNVDLSGIDAIFLAIGDQQVLVYTDPDKVPVFSIAYKDALNKYIQEQQLAQSGTLTVQPKLKASTHMLTSLAKPMATAFRDRPNVSSAFDYEGVQNLAPSR